MTVDREFLLDLAGYLRYSIDKKIEAETMLCNITHDVYGHLRKDKFFEPRISGYKKHIVEHLKDKLKIDK